MFIGIVTPGRNRGYEKGLEGQFPWSILWRERLDEDLPGKPRLRVTAIATGRQGNIDSHGVESCLGKGNGA